MKAATSNHLDVTPVHVDARCAALSLDLEYDYGGNGTEALHQFEDYLLWLEERSLHLTVFVEGRVLANEPSIAELLRIPDITAAMHCFDHRKPGDDRRDLERGKELFEECLGFSPRGYRAHTFQHSEELIADLIDLDFDWDSSYLPARFGFGARRNSRIESVCKKFNTRAVRYTDGNSGHELIELPVGTLAGQIVPFIQSYQLAFGPMSAKFLWRIFGTSKPFIHDAHMVDFYRATHSLDDGAISDFVKRLYQISWRGGRQNSLDILDWFIQNMSTRGFTWVSMDKIIETSADAP